MDTLISFVGGGNMAKALIGGLLKRGKAAATIRVVDRNEAQRSALATRHGIGATAHVRDAVAGADAIVWAVKPQGLREAIASAGPLPSAALHVSIAAGVRLADFERWVESARVVRAMPNTPALVGSGVTALLKGNAVTTGDFALVQRLFEPCGHVFEVEDDARMDAVTAITGSGPGYVFHFLESLATAAATLGFEPEEARKLALLTVQGAVRQALTSDEPLAVLCERVASRGGTTEAGLSVLHQRGVAGALRDAAGAACVRAAELGAELGRR